MTTAFRNIGGGASTGSVSTKVLMRTTRMGRASMARRRWYARSPRVEPRAMTTVAGWPTVSSRAERGTWAGGAAGMGIAPSPPRSLAPLGMTGVARLAGGLDVDVIRQLVDIIVGAREVVP